jgi:hypothetical protein
MRGGRQWRVRRRGDCYERARRQPAQTNADHLPPASSYSITGRNQHEQWCRRQPREYPFCTGTLPSVRFVESAQNSVFCRVRDLVPECAAKFTSLGE